MKVLITGGYGFIGSHVADRFHQEGYEVFIIDNLKTGKKENVACKHKGYILSVEDQKCAEVFKSHKFDIVVHLAAQVSVARSVSNPTGDAESNVVGLVNILNLSSKYGVKKFIYASSAAVYGYQTELPIREDAKCAPISPYGISKASGELYCRKWEELYGIPSLQFRFSNVYGPRQDGLGEGGVISTFMTRLTAGETFIVHGDGEQTRDFIYVEDVAYAIFRSCDSPQTGVYNLSSNTQTSINQVIEVLNEIQQIDEVRYTEKRVGDIDHSVLDNSKAIRDFDWAPLYTIEEGLEKTAAYFMSEIVEQQTATISDLSPNIIRARQTFWKFRPTIENLAAFGLIAWLTILYTNVAYNGIDVKLIYITIIGMLYGSRQAMLAVGLSLGLFVYQKLAAGRDFISLTYDTDFFFQIAIYLFVGLVVGYTIERKNTMIRRQELIVSEVNNRYEFLDSIYTEVRDVKEELQSRILNASDSYGKIYSATKELESLEPEQVFGAAVSVIKSIMQAPNVLIYMVNENGTYLRLLASDGYHSSEVLKSLKVSEHGYIAQVIQTGKMFTNKDLNEVAPLMAAPLIHNGKVTAIVAIDGLPFESFSLYHQNLFQITADLISSALSKALTYIAATEAQRYLDQTMILKPEVFSGILNSKKQAFDQYQVPYLLLQAKTRNLSYSDTAEHLTAKLRETDYIGMDERGNLLVLLSNTGKYDEEHILNRLTNESISLLTVSEG